MNKEIFTFFSKGPFSQWYHCRFTINDQKFNCAEQAMMFYKANLFRDEFCAELILKSNSPKEQKQLGRKVKKFKQHVWDDNARRIVYWVNVAKFTQNIKLLELLLSTKGTTLVEASPYDNIWGIGLSETNPMALDRLTWRGKNWLGEVLTKLRNNIETGNLVQLRYKF